MKPKLIERVVYRNVQPPSGGCVLKLMPYREGYYDSDPAAFGRLCVETRRQKIKSVGTQPAAFGRLCVETLI